MGGRGDVLSIMQNPPHESSQPAVGYSDTVTVVSQVDAVVGVGVRGGDGPTAAMALLTPTALLLVRMSC